MSQHDECEDDIWEYKPLKKKRREGSLPADNQGHSKRTSKRHNCSSVKSSSRKVTLTDADASITKGDVSYTRVNIPGQREQEDEKALRHLSPPPPAAEVLQPAGAASFCPVCQMPFSILVVQSQRWHVAGCLDTPREDDIQECPVGLQCSSTIPNHYQRYNHTLLAHSRSAGDTDQFALSQEVETGRSHPPGPESSQDTSVNSSPLSNRAASPVSGHVPSTPTPLKNGLLLLRSPGPDDVKKKKGWLTPSRGRKPTAESGKKKAAPLLSSPGDTNGGGRARGKGSGEAQPSPYDDDDEAISFSPLSELPADVEVEEGGFKRALFSPGPAENKEEESALPFSRDSFSSEDELLDIFLDIETDHVPQGERASPVPGGRVRAVSSLAPANRSASSAAVDHTRNPRTDGEPNGKTFLAAGLQKTTAQSAQCVVLERLRDTLSGSRNSWKDGSPQTGLPAATEQPPARSSPSSSQTSPQSVTPRKGQCKPARVAPLKQTDIGVFFGLKPLRETQGEPGTGSQELGGGGGTSPGESQPRGNGRRRREVGERGRKSKAAATGTAGSPADAAPAESTGDPAGSQREGERGGRRMGGRRWSRGTAGGGDGRARRCPFYKKIPGTKFAIDAFSYGEIEDISAYFLTHFHSDHYGGLTKKSALPIYCNRITGNLVRSKLRVEERFIHVLPMNTRVMVEGVGVILLEANHCPGAAMLLFFLPGGQTVLHTGDFRADPKMETYPELLSCRVQTLYLDTTYCSPEYTFPSQQEAVSFAANTAFELVALHPRTLVVCGSYSVGKEKVFLALAEVLGSKVCLSRDKYNTMCCLESEPIKRLLTTDWNAAQVHVLPMMQLNVKKLHAHLSRFVGRYDRLVAFKPTGWTFTQQMDTVEDIQPQISGNITVYGVPYSEHSSFVELKRFVQWLQPLSIVPTVNGGSWSSRKAMEKCFSEWLAEAKANR